MLRIMMITRLRTLSSSLRTAGLMAAVVLACAGFTTRSSAPAGPQDFILHNSTGATIRELYISPVSTNEWEEDVLGADVLPHGESAEITFDASDEAMWDLKIVNTDGGSFMWRELNLMSISEVTLTIRNGRTYATVN
jgi:hypothetical protein